MRGHDDPLTSPARRTKVTKVGARNRARVTLASGVVAAVIMAGSVFSFAGTAEASAGLGTPHPATGAPVTVG